MRTSAFHRFLSTLVALALLMPLGGSLLTIETASASHSQCSDGVDNDDDRRIDYPTDSDCTSIDDNSEDIDNGVFVTVTDNRDQVAPGDAITYIIALKQQRDAVKLVNVALPVPSQNSIVSTSDDGTIRDGSVLWHKVAVFKNNIRRLTVHVVTSPYVEPGQLLVARVTADGSQASDTTMVEGGRAIPYVQNQLEVSIDDHRESAQPGDILEYLVTVRNPGDTRTAVHVRVKIPSALRVIDARGADFLGSDIVWQNITVNPGQERTFVFRASVDTRLPQHFPIQVVARAGNVIAYDRTVTGGGSGPYALFSSITDNRDTAERGDLLTYVIHVDNTSGSLDPNASISAGLPIHSEFVSATEGGTWDGTNVRWLHTTIAPNGSRDLEFTVRVRTDAPDGTLLRASARVRGFVTSDITQVGGYYSGYREQPYDSQSLSVEKRVDRPYASAGSSVTYTITVRNMLDRELIGIDVNDAYDAAVLRITDPGSGSVRNGRIFWILDALSPGEVRTFTYTGRLTQSLRSDAGVLNTARAYIGASDVGYVPTGGYYDDRTTFDHYLLPVTGVGDFFAPLENTAQFLSPIRSATEGNGLPALLWLGLIAVGLAAGMFLGKKIRA